MGAQHLQLLSTVICSSISVLGARYEGSDADDRAANCARETAEEAGYVQTDGKTSCECTARALSANDRSFLDDGNRLSRRRTGAGNPHRRAQHHHEQKENSSSLFDS
jgi:hypothetical protein